MFRNCRQTSTITNQEASRKNQFIHEGRFSIFLHYSLPHLELLSLCVYITVARCNTRRRWWCVVCAKTQNLYQNSQNELVGSAKHARNMTTTPRRELGKHTCFPSQFMWHITWTIHTKRKLNTHWIVTHKRKLTRSITDVLPNLNNAPVQKFSADFENDKYRWY